LELVFKKRIPASADALFAARKISFSITKYSITKYFLDSCLFVLIRG
jgi:hypothetical protein